MNFVLDVGLKILAACKSTQKNLHERVSDVGANHIGSEDLLIESNREEDGAADATADATPTNPLSNTTAVENAANILLGLSESECARENAAVSNVATLPKAQDEVVGLKTG